MGVLTQQITDRWAIYNGDCIEVMHELPDEVLHGSIYSPPFAGLYHYSSDDRDLSNARTYEEFAEHYGYVLDEITRLTIPGRTTGVHAAPIPSGNTGKDSLRDFPGDVIRWHLERGWEWVSRHVIWKEPLAVRLRTMQKNLAHQTIINDGAAGGVASADELLIFRKPGAGTDPAEHPTGLHDYAGATPVPADLMRYRGWDGPQTTNRYSQWVWRQYASSVWDDIRIDRVLPFRESRSEDDEKHVHPLQLDVIARYLHLRTRPGEKVLTPFMGVGSEVYEAVRQGRYAIGAELKPEYYVQATRNLAAVDAETVDTPSLLGELAGLS
ncbi:MAG: DNA methyltransferase [Georgenia sp.]